MDQAQVPPIIDAEGMNAALLAANNPRAALAQIRGLVREAKQLVRYDADRDKIFDVLNKIQMLSGGIA